MFGKSAKKIKVSLKSDKTDGTLRANCDYIVLCCILLRMRNVSDKICRENQNTPCTFTNFFSVKNRAF